MLKHIGTLGRKRQATNQDFADACLHATEFIPRSHIDAVVEETYRRFDQVKRENDFSRFAIAYSGGKDSLAMHALFPSIPFFWVRCNLEYTAVSDFIAEQGAEVVNTGQDLKWLRDHPKHLFPVDSNGVTKWSAMVHWVGQEQYFKANRLDCMLMGRRKKDGNRMGRHDEDLYRNNDGVTRFAPIWLWTHEETFAYLAYNDVKLPPCYWWTDGFRVSTNPWPKRRSPNHAIGWARVYEVEPALVHTAAEVIPSAANWLKEYDM